MRVVSCLGLAACQIFPSYYPAEVRPFDGEEPPAPTHETGVDVVPTGDTATPVQSADTGDLGGRFVTYYPYGTAGSPPPCDSPIYGGYFTTLSVDNPQGRTWELFQRADDCTETLWFVATELERTVSLPESSSFVIYVDGLIFCSVAVPDGNAAVDLEIP